ncbi:MAG: hypothetical protein AAED33_14915 [Paracoccaceae bacterium]
MAASYVSSVYSARMSRRSTPQKQQDQRRFPVMVRVKVPDDGFGKQLNEIHDWLRGQVGNNGYAVHSDNQPGNEAMAIYLNDPTLAAEVVKLFDLIVS